MVGMWTFSVVAEERWKCLVCEFSNALDRPTCVLCGTKRNDSTRRGDAVVIYYWVKGLVVVLTGGDEADSQVVDLEEVRLKRSMHRLSSASAPQGPATNNLRLSMLNPRQQYARCVLLRYSIMEFSMEVMEANVSTDGIENAAANDTSGCATSDPTELLSGPARPGISTLLRQLQQQKPALLLQP